jgi:hypothetical protein
MTDAHEHFHRLVSVVKMATVLEEYTIEEQRSVVHFCEQKNIHEEIFPVYGGKCLSRKAVHNWVEKFSQGRSNVADDETELRKWLRQQSKDFCVAVFDALVK